MTLSGIFTLCFVAAISIDVARATECSSLIAGSSLVVPENTECTLSSGLTGLNDILVHGTIQVTAASNVQLSATIVHVLTGGKIAADNLASGGYGAGNTLGSGGKNVILMYFYGTLSSTSQTLKGSDPVPILI